MYINIYSISLCIGQDLETSTDENDKVLKKKRKKVEKNGGWTVNGIIIIFNNKFYLY